MPHTSFQVLLRPTFRGHDPFHRSRELSQRPGFREKSQVTRLSSSPTVALLLAESARGGDELEAVRRLNIGGGPIFPNMLPILKQSFKNAATTIVYGSSEAEPISELESVHLTEHILQEMKVGKGLFAGKPVEAIICQIAKGSRLKPTLSQEELNDALCKSDEPGEIIVTGEHVLKGYLQGIGDEENKLKTPKDIWHRTGDLGYFDKEGNLWLLGRAMAAKENAGHTLYPFAIECEVCTEYNLPRAAYLFHEGKHVLVIEEPYPNTLIGVGEQRHIREKYGLDKIISVRQIPLDTRHRAKIEYEKLKRLCRL